MTDQQQKEPRHFTGLGVVVGILGLVMVVWSVLLYVELGVAVGSAGDPEFSPGLNFLMENITMPLWGFDQAPPGSVGPAEIATAIRRTIWICLGLGAFLTFSGGALVFRRKPKPGF